MHVVFHTGASRDCCILLLLIYWYRLLFQTIVSVASLPSTPLANLRDEIVGHILGKTIIMGRFPCPLCEKTFKDKSGLRRHNQAHTGNFSFWCEKCSQGFTVKTNYDAHMAKHEGITFPCDRCGKRFRAKGRLKAHYRVHFQ